MKVESSGVENPVKIDMRICDFGVAESCDKVEAQVGLNLEFHNTMTESHSSRQQQQQQQQQQSDAFN